MTMHVLHAGDGYTYLTRQVASGDHQPLRGQAMSDYYLAEGNPPGRWVGSGRVAMDVDGQVTEAQMKALFGEGVHPDAQFRIRSAIARGASLEDARASVRLGRRYPVIDHSGELWRDRLDGAYRQFHEAHGRRPERGAERVLVRWNVATELSRETQHRDPVDDGELKGFVARVAKPPRQPVAGVDLVFTPVKSVSVLWALGDERVRAQVEQAHEAAWRRAFAYVEQHAALTRTGAAGIAQVDTRGLVAAAVDHPDPGRGTRTCIRTSRSRRRCKAWTGSGGRWTCGCCTRWRSAPARPTTRESRMSSGHDWGSSSPRARAGGAAAGAGDRRYSTGTVDRFLLAPEADRAGLPGGACGLPAHPRPRHAAPRSVKLLHAHDRAGAPDGPVPADLELRPGDVILIDEAGMAGTPALGRLLTPGSDRAASSRRHGCGIMVVVGSRGSGSADLAVVVTGHCRPHRRE